MLILRRTLLFFVLLFHINSHAYDFEELNIEQGVDLIKDICRDQNGYLWLTNGFQGIICHNSNKSVSFMHEQGDTTSLSHNEAFCLHVDPFNNLWVGTANGLNRYDRKTKSFKRYLNKEDWKQKQFNGIFQVYTDSESNLWAIKANAVCKYDYETDTFTEYEEPTHMQGLQLRGIVQDLNGKYWIATNEEFIFEFDLQHAILKKVVDPLAKSEGLIQKSIYIDQDGEIWISTKGEGLVKFDPTYKSFKHYPVSNDGTGTNGAHIFDILPWGADEILLAVDQGGINIFNKKEETFKYITAANSDLPGDGVFCLYQDDSNNLWIGTSRYGVLYDNPYRMPFKTYRFEERGEHKLDNVIGCFYEDNNKDIWIGSDGGGIKVLNDAGDKKLTYRKEKNSWLKSDVIRNIIKYGKNGVLVTDWNGSLSFANGKSTGKLSRQLSEIYPAGNIWNTIVDLNNRIWFGLPDGTLAVFDEDQSFIGHYLPPMQNLFNDSPFMIEDADGGFYLSNYMGIFKLDALDDEPILIIPEDRVATFKIKDNLLIVGGVDFGIRIYDKSGNYVTEFTKEKGLSSNIIKSIEIDDSGGIWVSTTNGLNLINAEQNHIQRFYDVDGLADNQFFMQASYKTKDGQLYFGSYNGMTRIDPLKITHNTNPPKLNVENITIYMDAQGENIVRELVPNDTPIVLSHNENMFVVDYSAIWFSNQRQIEYEYILDGFNDNWISVPANNNSITYTNLDPGEYKLRIKVSSSAKLWSDQEISVQINIEPPYWKTWWWYLLLVLLSVSVFILILRFRVYRLKRDKSILENKVKERTSIIADQNEELHAQTEELEKHRNKLEELVSERTTELLKAKKNAEDADALKLRFLANMSHEIRTPMHAIVGFTSIMQYSDLSPEERQSYFELINHNADNLMALIEDIIDISRIEANQLTIKTEAVNVTELLSSQYEYFKLKVQNNPLQTIKLNISESARNLVINTDALRVTQIITNLAGNALKYCEVGLIEIGLLTDEDYCEIYVNDNGPGIAKEHQKVIFDTFATLEKTDKQAKRGVGLGLSISKQLAQLLKGELLCDSKPGHGTKMSLRLPL